MGKAEAVTRLSEMLAPGATVHTILRHRSASGMTRAISPVIVGMDCQPADVSYMVAPAIGARFDNRWDGVKVHGTGMDMGFHLVYSLSSALFPDGFDCIGEGCPSNDHSNRDERAHHPDGGYALRQRWL